MAKFYYLLLFLMCSQIIVAQSDGSFEDYFENGEVKIQGQYKNKQRIGEWKEYHPNGQVSSVYTYDEGKRSKEYTSYFDNGIIRSETILIKGDYVSKGYYASGKLQYERIFNDGYYREYSEDGTLVVESNYADGELDGMWKQYYDSGELLWQVAYKNGYKEGKYQNYYKNGQLKLEGKTIKGKKEGEEKRYRESGELEWSGNYKASQLHKNWSLYDILGKVVEKIKYDEGKATNTALTAALTPTEIPDGEFEKVPIYPGCEESLTNREARNCMSQSISTFIAKKFNTEVASGTGLTGNQRIYVIFKIDKDGMVKNIKARAPLPILEAEAIRVIGLLPKMRPGMQKGKEVTVPYSLPILFRIPESKIKKRN